MNIPRTSLFLSFVIGCCIAHGEEYRLPKGVYPIQYTLELQPFINEGYFGGEVYIEIFLCSEVDVLYLHATKLKINLVGIDGNYQHILYELEEEFELLKVYLIGWSIGNGYHTLHFKFEGSLLHEDEMGLVKGTRSYGKIKEDLVISNFEATFARRAFPCFDEPEFKAVFNFKITTPDDSWTVLTNIEESYRMLTPTGMKHFFQKTPKMSTYLICIAITKMNFEEIRIQYNYRYVNIRTFLNIAEKEKHTNIALLIAKSMMYFEELTNVTNPLSKIDLLEHDREYAATEYWGLTTFNTSVISTDKDKGLSIPTLVAHEMAHYWFGNLVTNTWWDDLWLHEGFAEYLSMKFVDDEFGTNTVQNYLFGEKMSSVFKDDRESEFVNPIVSERISPKDIKSSFNNIIYTKAASLIRQLHVLVEDENFKKIIRRYFQSRSLNTTATTKDFISVVEQEMPNSNLKEFFETWLQQNRYPIINIEEDSINNQYVLRQQSASMYKKTDNMSSFGYKWTIPISYITDIQTKPTTVWFMKDREFLRIPKGNEKFIKLNYNHTGIYFTNYTEKMWNNLIDNFLLLGQIEQASLIQEAQRLFEAEIINCDVSLRLFPIEDKYRNTYGVTPSTVHHILENTWKSDNYLLDLLQNFLNETGTPKVTTKCSRIAKQPIPKYSRCARWLEVNFCHL